MAWLFKYKDKEHANASSFHMKRKPNSHDGEQRFDLNPRPIDQIIANPVCVDVLVLV